MRLTGFIFSAIGERIGKWLSCSSRVSWATPATSTLGSVALVFFGAAAHAACEKNRFMLQGAYAVDRQTGLIWQRCTAGSDWRAGRCQGEQQAMALSEAKAAAVNQGAEWRLPTAPELASLIDPGCGSPAINQHVFPGLVDDGEGAIPYWSSSQTGVAGLMTFVDFANARVDGHSPGFGLFVRFVKSAPPAGRPSRQ